MVMVTVGRGGFGVGNCGVGGQTIELLVNF